MIGVLLTLEWQSHPGARRNPTLGDMQQPPLAEPCTFDRGFTTEGLHEGEYPLSFFECQTLFNGGGA